MKKIIILLSFTFFFFLDFIYSNLNLKKLSTVTVYDRNFEYNFVQNLNTKDKFGSFIYDLCTNSFGMKISCKEKKNPKTYKLALIGDSFVEGIGLNFDDTFAGILEKDLNYNIANLGLRSYSPSNYKEKILYFIKQGFNFDHIIIFIDISDIQDEDFRNGKIRNNKKKITNSFKYKNFKEFLKFNFQLSYYIFFKIKNFIRSRNLSEKIFNNHDAYNENYLRGSWTYKKNNPHIKNGLHHSLKNMENLVNFLKKNQIEYSIAVYPWPQQLLFDEQNSIHVKIWKNFCEKNSCKYFFDFFKVYHELIEKNELEKIILNYYFYTDVHINKKGNEVIASLLRKKLKK